MAKWKEDPQGRPNIDEVTEVLELPIFNPDAKGKLRPWLAESWNKIEDKLVDTATEPEMVELIEKHRGGFNEVD